MISLLSESSKGICFIVSAPAGTGKTTLVRMLMDEFPEVIANISFTTRKPRTGEIEGKHYHFLSPSEFEKKVIEGDFLEYVNLYGSFYGTSKTWVEEKLKAGKHVILVIDTQGVKQLKDKISAIKIFISPPSLEILKARLMHRNTEDSEMIEKRLEWAMKEMERISYYDYNIINDDLSTAYQVLRSILIAETHRLNR